MMRAISTIAFIVAGLALGGCDALLGVSDIVVADAGLDATEARDGRADARADVTLRHDTSDVGVDANRPADAKVVDVVTDVTDGAFPFDAIGLCCGTSSCTDCAQTLGGTVCMSGGACGCNSSNDCPVMDGAALGCVPETHQCCLPSGYICTFGYECCSDGCDGVCQ